MDSWVGNSAEVLKMLPLQGCHGVLRHMGCQDLLFPQNHDRTPACTLGNEARRDGTGVSQGQL